MSIRARSLGLVLGVAAVGCGGGGSDQAPTDDATTEDSSVVVDSGARLDSGVDSTLDSAKDADAHADSVTDVAPDTRADSSSDTTTTDTAPETADAEIDSGADTIAEADAAIDVSCADGSVACGATCVDLTSDVHNCGACGNDCLALAYVTGAACSSGACVITSCYGSHGDCNSTVSDGCETNMNTAAHCGSCAPCAEPTPDCSLFSPYKCVSPCYGATPDRCDAACTNTKHDLNNCGACDVVCTPPTHATPICFYGTCDFVCDEGYVRDGSTCVAAPRPIAPLSTSHVTTRRPTLRWAPAPGTTDVTLDVCLDRACTKPIGTPTHLTTTSWAPTSDLPIGVVYWRLHPGTSTTVTSVTWQFVVGARSAPTDTSWGTTLDVNGDGYTDLAVGGPAYSGNTGRVWVYLGSASGSSATAATVLTGLDGTSGYFGQAVASADVNGDGFADLVVGAHGASKYAGRAYVYLGSATGLATLPFTTLVPVSSGDFGQSVTGAGDLDGDGYGDVVVGAPSNLGAGGAVAFYLGSAKGLSTSPTTTALGLSLDQLGFSLANAGDVDADGHADLLAGAPTSTSNTGYASLFAGATSTTSWKVVGPDGPGWYYGATLVGIGDTNGDGRSDVAITAANPGAGTSHVFVYVGGASGLATTATIIPSPTSGASFGGGLGGGDVNGDGYDDLCVGAGSVGGVGDVYAYFGGATGLSTTPSTTIVNPDPAGAQFGWNTVGDVNGDGYADVIVAEDVLGTYGSVRVFLGSASGPSTTAATTLVSPDAFAQFGTALCAGSN